MSQAAIDAVWWAQLQSILGIAGFAAVLLTLYYTGKAAVAASRAANAAAEAVGTERAWISLLRFERAIATNVTIRDTLHPKALVMSLTLQNSGRSPALNAELYIETQVVGADEDVPNFVQKPSNDARRTMLGPAQEGHTSFTAIPWHDLLDIQNNRKNATSIASLDISQFLTQQTQNTPNFACWFNQTARSEMTRAMFSQMLV